MSDALAQSSYQPDRGPAGADSPAGDVSAKPPRKHRTALIAGVIAAVVALFVGVVVVVHNRAAAQRKADDERRMADGISCVLYPDRCGPDKQLPATLDQWLAASGFALNAADAAKKGIAHPTKQVGEVAVDASVEHAQGVLYDVVCEASTHPAPLTQQLLDVLRDCASATMPPGTAYSADTVAWLRAQLRPTSSDGVADHWSCGRVAMVVSINVTNAAVEITPSANDKPRVLGHGGASDVTPHHSCGTG